MFHILHRGDQRKGAIAAVEFEGKPYGAGVSFLIGDVEPGKGPRLHKHPYSETCIVRFGKAAMTVDGKEVVAGPGDIVVIGPETPHRFTAIGDERLDMIAIHANDCLIIEWLSDSRQSTTPYP
jgi:mannose-6-phosphate isomerase-like protein (cupin superfamily)